jgi:hypothetical protein
MLKNLPVMTEAGIGNFGLRKSFLLPESNEVDDVNKASETGGVFYLIPLLKNTYSRYIYSHLQITVDVVRVNLLFLQLVSN